MTIYLQKIKQETHKKYDQFFIVVIQQNMAIIL